MPTIRELLDQAKPRLAEISDTPALDADILLAHALSQSRSYVIARGSQPVSAAAEKQFTAFVKRRCDKEPIAYITGSKEFWSLDFHITHATLIPRPETEVLVEEVLKLFPHTDKIKLADLGTGCGTIALSIANECANWDITATDMSVEALQVASNNAQRFGLSNVSFYPGRWCTALPCKEWDVIVSNPPYIAENEWDTYAGGLAYEPRNALVSGEDGLDDIREICVTAKAYLKAGGYLLLEHGFSQGAAVREVFAKNGYGDIRSVRDLSGQERATIGCK